MSERIELNVAPSNVKLSKGESAESNITLRNRGRTVDQFTISIEGLDSGWYKLPVSSVALFPNDQDNLKIIFQIPETDVTPDTHYPFKLKAVSQENPADIAIASLVIELGVLPKLEMNISPARLSGRKGSYQILVNNPALKESQLQLRASAAKRGLRFAVRPESLTVPAGGKSEATIDVRLSWLALILGQRNCDFQVIAEQPGAVSTGPAGLVNGQLTNVPWYKFFSRIRIPWLSRPPVIQTFETKTDNKREFRLNWQVKRASRITIDGANVESQGESVMHPSEPTKYVLTASNRYGEISRTIEVKPLPLPQARASEKIKLSLYPNQFQVQAGIIPAQAIAQVQNLSDIVDKFMVEVEGLDETWYSRSASSLALMPQAKDQVSIKFQPPKKKGVKAGLYPFALTIRSQSMTNETASAVGQLEILPSTEIKMKINPFRITAMRKGSYRVNLANTSVSDASVVLAASDLDEGCRFQFKPEKLLLGAWNNVEVPMVVRPKRGSIIGEIKTFNVTATATAEGAEIQPAHCEFSHKPFMKNWKPIWRMIRAIIVIVILIVAIYYIIRLGGGWSALRESPQSWFRHLIETIEGWFS